jgi:hypothetical protein
MQSGVEAYRERIVAKKTAMVIATTVPTSIIPVAILFISVAPTCRVNLGAV